MPHCNSSINQGLISVYIWSLVSKRITGNPFPFFYWPWHSHRPWQQLDWAANSLLQLPNWFVWSFLVRLRFLLLLFIYLFPLNEPPFIWVILGSLPPAPPPLAQPGVYSIRATTPGGNNTGAAVSCLAARTPFVVCPGNC